MENILSERLCFTLQCQTLLSTNMDVEISKHINTGTKRLESKVAPESNSASNPGFIRHLALDGYLNFHFSISSSTNTKIVVLPASKGHWEA